MLERINKIIEEIANVKAVSLRELKKEDTALIVVDMIRGFSDIGLLASPRTDNIKEALIGLNERTIGYDKVFFIDNHTEQSTEFKSFPPHCIENSEEVELVPWLKDGATLNSKVTFIKKNSTNGFHVPEFKTWLDKHIHINNFIITGVCSDICVSNFALTLSSYFTQYNVDKRIIVPTNTLETYDLGSHDAELMNLFSLYNMKTNGIEVVKGVE